MSRPRPAVALLSPSRMSLFKDRASNLRRYLASLIPTRRVTAFNARSLPAAVAATLTVDAVHNAIAAAEAGDVGPLFGLYNEVIATDSHLQGCFVDRKEAVLSDTLSIQPWDKKSPDDIVAAAAIEAMIADLPNWENACAHLLDSHLWPVSLLEKTFRPTTRPGLRYELAELVPVPCAFFSYQRGKLEILPTNEEGQPMGGEGAEPKPGRYIIHRGHLLSLPDNWGGPMRSILFWWLLSMMDRDWWARFLDRHGSPFLVGRYDQAADDSRLVLLQAFQLSQKMGGLVVSKETEVEIHKAAVAGTGEAYKAFIDLCNREKSKLVLGETLSTETQSSGHNAGNAKIQAEKRSDKRQSDARRLAATLRHQLFTQYLRINGFRGRAPLAIWGALSAGETSTTGKLVAGLAAGRIQVSDAGLETLSERLGLPIERIPDAVPTPAGSSNALGTLKGPGMDPIRAIIQAANSQEEAVAKVQAFCARTFNPSRAARTMEEAMIAIYSSPIRCAPTATPAEPARGSSPEVRPARRRPTASRITAVSVPRVLAGAPLFESAEDVARHRAG